MIVTIFVKFPQDIDTLAETIRELFNLRLRTGRQDGAISGGTASTTAA